MFPIYLFHNTQFPLCMHHNFCFVDGCVQCTKDLVTLKTSIILTTVRLEGVIQEPGHIFHRVGRRTIIFAHASHVVYALYAHAMQLQFTARAPALLGVAPCLYAPSTLTHAHVQLGKTPQYGSCICQRSLFVTIVGRDSSAAKRHRLEAG